MGLSATGFQKVGWTLRAKNWSLRKLGEGCDGVQGLSESSEGVAKRGEVAQKVWRGRDGSHGGARKLGGGWGGNRGGLESLEGVGRRGRGVLESWEGGAVARNGVPESLEGVVVGDMLINILNLQP